MNGRKIWTFAESLEKVERYKGMEEGMILGKPGKEDNIRDWGRKKKESTMTG